MPKSEYSFLTPVNFICTALLVTFIHLVSLPTFAASSAKKTTQGVQPPPYKLISYGSDTLANLMYFWAQTYTAEYPNIEIELHSEGSSTAVEKLINNQADLGPMSRLMTESEVAAFVAQFGYAPTAIQVAMDALAVFVNRNNPLQSVSVSQLDGIYSARSKCGSAAKIDSWDELGLTGDWQYKRIELIGRNKASGTHTFFRKKVLCNGQFKSRVLEQPGSTSLVQVISHSDYAIGFSGFGFKTSGVKALPISINDGQVVAPTTDTVRNQSYPLARFLYLYVKQPVEQALPEKVLNFLKIVLSVQGQRIVENDGYISLSETKRQAQLNKLRH